MIIGVIVGFFYYNLNNQFICSSDTMFSGYANLYEVIILLGDIFVRLLKMIIAPLILTSIIIGISSIKNQTKVGRLGLKTFLYYISTSLIAILIGLVLANTIEPGSGASKISDVEAFDTSNLDSSSSILDILKRMIPENPILYLLLLIMICYRLYFLQFFLALY